MEKLTLKQERFVSSYLETGNASKAYRVSYEVQNMKPESINRKVCISEYSDSWIGRDPDSDLVEGIVLAL